MIESDLGANLFDVGLDVSLVRGILEDYAHDLGVDFPVLDRGQHGDSGHGFLSPGHLDLCVCFSWHIIL